MREFIKLDAKELENSLVEDSIKQIERAVVRKRMDLEDAVMYAKQTVKDVSNITTLKDFDPATWVDKRNNALNNLAYADAELKNFNKNFEDKGGVE